DCWVFRGPPRSGMSLDFAPGLLGCDNRLAHELEAAGYTILDPYLTVRVLHFHTSADRNPAREERVPPPYAYPKKSGLRARMAELCVGASYAISNRFARFCNSARVLWQRSRVNDVHPTEGNVHQDASTES